ncbi:MAG: M20 family metallopeptidase [Gemmatimonadota bacterium]|nr:M20 family metallopeptidase [Gemmatimonadota bacterium]
MSPEIFSRIVDFRRELHSYPELSWKEEKTSEKIVAYLDRLGIECKKGVVGAGIVADIPGESGAGIVALRADIDALPISEETGLDFASKNSGVMHACGHDGHTAIVMGAAELLLADSNRRVGVRLIFQPAEEVGEGAKAMVGAGVLDGVEMIFGGHVDRQYPVGVIVPHEGAINASADTFGIEVVGKGAHAARPHEGVDSIVAASAIVSALQTIAAREGDPAKARVVTVGSFHAGTANNVIASSALLEGTVRALDPEVRRETLESVKRIAEGVARTYRAQANVDIRLGTPPVINTREMASLAREAARAVVGDDGIKPLATANMGGEDFAFYLEKIPGAFVRYGSGYVGRENAPAHSSKFDIDEGVLAVGARYLHQVVGLAEQRLLKDA